MTSRSVLSAQEKAREQRLQRLKKTLAERVTDPIPTVDALMAELQEGAGHADLWEQLHAAAVRDGIEKALEDAYQRCIAGPRMKRMTPEGQAAALMHAADYYRGVLGNEPGADQFLERAVAVKPDHVEAFQRLERRLESLRDTNRLVSLYANVGGAANPPKPPAMLAGSVSLKLHELAAPNKEPASDDTLRKLVALVRSSPKLLDALEKHSRATKRPALACELMEKAIAAGGVDDAMVFAWRERLVDLYLGEAQNPAGAIDHVEKILEKDPTHVKAFAAGDKLLSVGKVNSRAAAALAAARRARRGGTPSQPPPAF